MKATRSALVLGVVAVAAALAASCSLFTDTTRFHKFTITIDSIVVPDTVNSTDTLIVGLRGIISTDGCGSFDSYTRERNGGTIKYTAIGLIDDRKLCIATLVLLRVTDTVLPPQVNPTTITANNPPGAFPTSRTVVVK